MNLDIRLQDANLAEALRGYVDRRLRFALGRFGDRVGYINVRVSGQNGPRGAARICRISAEILPFGSVAVEERDFDLYAAVDRATGRLGRLFGQRLERAQHLRVSRETVRREPLRAA